MVNCTQIGLRIKMTTNAAASIQKSGVFTSMDLTTAFATSCAGKRLKSRYVCSLDIHQ